MGYCPSGRLFEAAACGAAILSDAWEGLDAFFEARRSEILVARSDRRRAGRPRPLAMPRSPAIARAGRERVLAEHTSAHRAVDVRGRGRGGARAASGRRPDMWGIVPAAGRGSRIQPLAFSKELLPVGSRLETGVERPCAVSEYLLERMVAGGATKICFVISPGKSDILAYYGGGFGAAPRPPMWFSRARAGFAMPSSVPRR